MQRKNIASRLLRSWMAATLVLVFMVGASLPGAARAADRGEVERFLKVTGFDVALKSIALGALDAPKMLGQDPGDFGIIWKRVVDEVMQPQELVETATGMLERTLDQNILEHALDFYGSDLGQAIVAAENAAHMEPDDGIKDEAGQAIVAALVRAGAEGRARLDYFRRMAVDSAGLSLRAIQEIQIRFLLAASAHGVIAMQMDEKDLREFFRQQEGQMRTAILANALANAAYTYQALSDDELRQYTEALEAPDMREVYRLMNAIHYEITASRYEMLAAKMAGLRPSEEL